MWSFLHAVKEGNEKRQQAAKTPVIHHKDRSESQKDGKEKGWQGQLCENENCSHCSQLLFKAVTLVIHTAWQNEIDIRSQGHSWTQIPMSRFRSKAIQGQDNTTHVLTENIETDSLGCRASDWEIMDLISYEESVGPVLLLWIAQVRIHPTESHGSMNM